MQVLMQNAEVISVNIWQIVASLCNLVILFLILKRFLYKPVKKVLAQRQAALDEKYSAAAAARSDAEADRAAWAEKMQTADAEAAQVIKTATEQANRRSDQIVGQAKEKAAVIVREAQTAAEQERVRAEAQIKREIADVSVALTEKFLARKVSPDDHRTMIDEAIAEMGENDD
ncbi:MAG: F0F1 ATP synthase subunit B [Eubacteriales bacterium]|nr:F0F1 ATP synthase subunit B [Eubacteriales bacterium]